MVVAFVQYDNYKNTSTNQASIATDNAINTTTGNLLVVATDFWNIGGAGVTVSSVTDTEGNTYVKAISQVHATSYYHTEIWYCANSTGNANNIATITFSSAAADYPHISFSEYSGVATSDALEDTSGNYETNVKAHTSGDATCASDDAVIIGVYSGNGNYLYLGSGFSSLGKPSIYSMAEYKIISSSGDYDADASTLVVGNSVMCCAIFSAAAAAGWTGTIDGITDPGKVNGVGTGSITSINGVS